MATNKSKDTAKSKTAEKDKNAGKTSTDDSLKGLEGLVAEDAPMPKTGAPDMPDAPDAPGEQIQPDPNAPSMSILAQYVKDLSFENPNPINPPQIEGGRPPMEVKINISINKIENEDYEVALEIKVESKAEETILFIAELSYAGLFRIRNIPEEQLKAILQIEAPRQIFPFARHILAEVTAFSGSAPVLLDPGIFAAVYQQMQQQAQDKENSQSGEGAEEAKN